MAQRPGFLVSMVVPCDGGESPNAFVPQVTVEIRVHAPARQMRLAAEVLANAMAEATLEMGRRLEDPYGRARDESGLDAVDPSDLHDPPPDWPPT